MIRVVAAAALIAAAACTPSVRTGTPEPQPSASERDGASLESLLFDDAPPGYVPDPSGTRSFTIDQAGEGAEDPAELRERLQLERFVTGFARLWVSDDEETDVIFAYVYEFEDAAGAKAELDSGIAEARRDGSEQFDVPQIPGAVGVTNASVPGGDGDEDATFHAVSFTRGARYYLVAIGGLSVHTQQEAIDLAIRMSAVAR